MMFGAPRLTAWSGAAVVALMLASLAVSPGVGALGANAAPGDRAATLCGLYLAGLAWITAFGAFVAALEHDLRSRHDDSTALLARLGFAGGLLNAAAIGVSLVWFGRSVFASGSAAAAQDALDAGALANGFTGFATALCVAGFTTALRRIGRPRWLALLGAAVVVHHLASAAALARSGPWSPLGVVSLTAPLGMTLWVGSVAALAWADRSRP